MAGRASTVKERSVHKIHPGYQIKVMGQWHQVTYVSRGRSFYSGREYYSFRLANGTMINREKGHKLPSRNRKEAARVGRRKTGNSA